MAPTSRSSQGSEDSTLPLSTSGSDASDRSSGTLPVLESSSDTGRLFSDGETSPTSPLLPTPNAQNFNDGQTEESWRARRARERAKGYNGNGGATPLAMAVPLIARGIDPNAGDLISSAAASPVSRSAPQDDEEARTMTDISGLSSAASSLKWNPATWSSRTSLVCSLQDDGWVIEQASLFGTTPLATFSETFPRWGSMHDGRVFAHPTPGRVTSESASSSLPTPDTMPDAYTKTPRAAANFETGHAVSLGQRIDHMLHTPTTGDTAPTYDHRASPGYTRAIPVPNLAAQVDDLLPTPHGRDKGTAGDVTGSEMTGGPNLTETVLSLGDHMEPPSEGGNE